MSHVDSLDEETKQILNSIQEQETHSDESKESDISKPHEKQPYQKSDKIIKDEHKTDEYNEYEEDDRDPLIDNTMEDSEW